MAVPILRLNVDDNPHIIVKQDNPTTIITGSTVTLIGSGNTTVNNVSGNTWVVYSPTGGTSGGGITALVGSGGTWTGLLSGTTWIVYTPDYTGLVIDVFNLENNFTGHTGNTSIHTPYSAITQAISAATSGLTSSWSGLTGLPTDNTDLVDLLSGYSLTSHTHTQYALVTTVTGLTSSFTSHTGDTSIHFKMSGITGFTSSDSFDNHTGNTDIHYPMSGISITESQISDLQDYTLQSDFTGLTESFNSHTGDTSIHFHMNDITGFTTTSDFNTYTGTTAPNTYFPISGYSFVASGACEIATSGNEVTIYAPSGGTGGGVSEAVFTGYTGVTAPATYAPLLASIKQVTGTSYTLLTTDSGKIIQFTATGATTITIPSGSTFLEGFQCTLVSYGNGTTSGVKTIAAQSGATVKSKLSMLKLATIFGAATVYKTPTAATWVAFGDLSA